MCMITYVPANIDIPWDGIENGAIFNDDGHGWAVASKKGIEVGKSMNYDLAALGLAQAREDHGPDSLVLFHSRFATHGTKDEYNVHPFYVDPAPSGISDAGGDTVMAHNGVLPMAWHPKHGDKRSDTRVFGDVVARLYTENGVPSRRGGKAMGTMIGGGNKLVFLTAKDGLPKVRIVNAHLGTFAGGVWYSNDGFLPSRWAGHGASSYWGGWSGGHTTTRTVSKITNVHGTITKSDDDDALVTGGGSGKDDCGFCGAWGSVDQAADICQACETCISCTEWMGDCLCYVPRDEQRDSIDDSVMKSIERGRAVELWQPSTESLWTPDSSPLNPQFQTAE